MSSVTGAQAEATGKGLGKSAKKQAKKEAKSKKKSDKRIEQKTTNDNNRNRTVELKLFQNSNLLNQQDPLEQLHQQINQLIRDDDQSDLAKLPSTRLNFTQQSVARAYNNVANQVSDHAPHLNQQQPCLSTPSVMIYNNQHLIVQDQSQMQTDPTRTNVILGFPKDGAGLYDGCGQDVFTVKKGVLWQQQKHEKFHQRLFNRWKKRYFILTTDYLVCFKRSTTRVGHSEMGKFLYKIALTDVAKLEWLRMRKNDKGPIVLHIRDRFDLHLWSKRDTDDWMMLIKESIERSKLRRGDSHLASINGQDMRSIPPSVIRSNGLNQGFYENAALPMRSGAKIKQVDENIDNGSASTAMVHSDQIPNNHPAMNSQTKASSRSSSSSRRPLNSSIDRSQEGTTLDSRSRVKSIEHEQQDNVNGIDSSKADGTVHIPQNLVRPTKQQSSASDGADRFSRIVSRDGNIHDGNNQLSAELSSRSHLDESEGQNPSIRPNMGDLKVIDSGHASGVNDAPPEAANFRAHRQASADNQQLASERVAGRRSGTKLDRPVSNLIRRDDSWQSLVSLTHVGLRSKNIQAESGNHQTQSPYARHIVPPVNDRSASSREQQQALADQRQRAINIDSTATPLRGRLSMRQHSIQSYSSKFPPIGQLHAQSFDLAPTMAQLPSSPSFHGANQQTAASHHQRLLQLQLLHNSNNVDYIRGSGGDAGRASNDCHQIYAPESIATTNHYGYYSMRSNLKSAASEFSFIRPNSSSFQEAQVATPMRTIHDNTTNGLGEQSRALLRNALVNQNVSLDLNNNYPSSLVSQNQLVTSDGIHYDANRNQQIALRRQLLNQPVSVDVIAPDRDLPLKPNKRRATTSDTHVGKNSSSFNIVGFFKRAFSRRSKRRPKLVESCSSSLAAFDSNLDQVQVAQSAFSTGSKTARADRMNQQSVEQPQRMIDLIEAFANKTSLDAAVGANQVPNQTANHEAPGQFGSIRPKLVRDHVGSPLHKSNSISASTGFSGLNEIVYRNQRMPDGLITGDQMASPLIKRSTKVMSANMTPLFAHKTSFDQTEEVVRMSPRNMRQMPRPSSIYGQPSLIASPVISSTSRHIGDNFGLLRNSVHGGSHRERSQNIDFRRQRTINAPQLDTTREVAEEVSSPTSEMRELLPREQLYDHEINARLSYNVMDSSSLVRPSRMGSYYTSQKQAVVNPILQSPTMSAIYDNHLSTQNSHRLSNDVPYSHYDNHHRSTSLHDPDRDASGYSTPRILIPAGNNRILGPLSSPQIQSGGRSSQAFVSSQSALYTPTRGSQTFRQDPFIVSDRPELTAEMDNRVLMHSKPAAIVAPTTPYRNQSNQAQSHMSNDLRDEERPANSSPRFIGQASPMRVGPNAAIVSPIASRRSINQAQLAYQQSPLVDEQTRILKRGSRVQTTIIAQTADQNGGSVKPHQTASDLVAASRTESDEAAASDVHNRNSSCNSQPATTTTLADNPSKQRSDSSTGASPQAGSRVQAVDHVAGNCRASDDQAAGTDKRANSSGSTADERSPSTGSRSLRSSASRQSSATSSEETETSKPETTKVTNGIGAKSNGKLVAASSKIKTNRPLADDNRRGSSTDQSDELTSQAGSIDEPDEKNWVNSKLVQ